MGPPKKDEPVEAPFIDLVLECNKQPNDDDSFSTLGLHSIFSEDDRRNAARMQARSPPRQHVKRKASGAGAALGKYLVESSDDDDEMDLRALLRKGSQLIETFMRQKQGLHGSFNMGNDRRNPRFQGNRWLESSGKSVSCRNLKYDGENYESSENSTVISKRSKTKACREIVSEAIKLTARSRSASPPPALQPVNDASGTSLSLLDASGKSGLLSEADDIDASLPSRSTRRSKSMSAGVSRASRRTPPRSNAAERESKTTEIPTLSSHGATARALNALVRQNSVTILNPSTPDSRKTMLSMGKSVSARNLTLDLDAKSSSHGDKRLTMRSKSSRHYLSTREKEEVELLPVSPGKRSRNSRRLATKPKSIRNLSAREEEDVPQLEPMPLSPVKRSSKKAAAQRETQATFNGRKFMSYNRSLSCRDLNAEEEPSINESTTRPCTPASEPPKRSSFPDRRMRPGTPDMIDCPELPKRSSFPAERWSNNTTSRPTTPASMVELPQRNSLAADSSARLARPDTPATFDTPPTRSSIPKSLSSFLQKRVENEKISVAVEAVPSNRRALLTRGGRSNSAQNIIEDGRKSMLSFGRSLSARSLTDAGGSVGGLSCELSPIPSSACLSSTLSVCQEESSRNEMDESMPGSVAGASKSEMDDSIPGSLPGLSPMTRLKPTVNAAPRSSSVCALSVVGEECFTQLVASPPLAYADSDAAYASGDNEIDPYQTTTVESESESEGDGDAESCSEDDSDSFKTPDKTATTKQDQPVFSTEEIRKEIGSPTNEALSPIREDAAKSPLVAKRAQACRRLSAHKEAKSPVSLRESFKGNTTSLQAALQKSVRAASLDRKRSSNKSRASASSLRGSTHDGNSKSKPPYKRTSSHDKKASSASYQRTSSHDSKALPASYRRTASHDSKAKRTTSHDKPSLRASSHDSKPSSGRARSQDGPRKKRPSFVRQSSVSTRLSAPDMKPSSLKAALHKSQLDSTAHGKKHSAGRRPSNTKQRVPRSVKKDERPRSSRNSLAKKEEGQKNMSASMQGSSRQRTRTSAGPTNDKSLSQSAHGSGRRRRTSRASVERTSRTSVERTISVSIHVCDQSDSKNGSDLNVSNSSQESSSRNHHKKKRQRSSRKLHLEESSGLEGSRSSQSSVGVHNKKDRKRRPSRNSMKESSSKVATNESSESRAGSPSCVAEYSPGEKHSPSHVKQVKEPRQKRNSVPGGSPHRSLKWAEKIHEGDEARFGSSLRDLGSTTGNDSYHEYACDKSHCSWSTADFSSVVW